MARATTAYQNDLIEALKDPCEAAAYLNAAMEDGPIRHYLGYHRERVFKG